MANRLSTKRLHIEKANAAMAIIVAIASFVVVFSLFASRGLLSKRSYQNKVIAEKKVALDQLKSNNQAATQLVDAYKVFASTPDNVIAGSSGGKGDKDGDNAQIILDALPSKYDFPAVASSLEKVLTDEGIAIDSITGIDDEINQAKQQQSSTPSAIPIPFQIAVKGDFGSLEDLFTLMERSIRPFQIQKVTLTASGSEITNTVTAQTYYQPAKNVSITKKVVE